MDNKINMQGPHQKQPIIYGGEKIENAKAAMIMIHSRGATAESILSLSNEFDTEEIAYIAPQAFGNTWYPYSFLSPVEMNEPGRTSGLALIDSIIFDFLNSGITTEKIFLLGFSQGACLSLEFAVRFPKRYGGIFGLSGGLIGARDELINYEGDLVGTEIFLGCSDIDPHIPLDRVNETEKILKSLNARVTKRIYEGMAHTINRDEIDFINALLKNRMIS